MKHHEITWEQLHVWMDSRLVAAGFDLDKEVKTWCKFENNSITLVYEQEDNAPIKEECKKVELPAYLRNKK